MKDQEPISSDTVCDLLDCAARAADMITGEKSDWPLRDRALQLLRILVEQEVALNGPLDVYGRSQALKHL